MSKYLNNYVIPFSGLKIGKHKFEFNCNKEFFECFEQTEIEDATIHANVTLEKQASIMVLHFELSGQIVTFCDRCSGSLILNESGNNRIIVKFGNEEETGSEEMVFLPEKEVDINVSHQLFEFSHLLLPLKKTHKEGECDEKMMKLLEKYSNHKDKDDIDPRWEALKKLK